MESCFVCPLADLTVYGHTVFEEMVRDYPEDIPMVERALERGSLFGRWYSRSCPDGELGFNPVHGLYPIGQDIFDMAREHGWPFVNVGSRKPSMAVAVLGEDGEIRTVWDSVLGDHNQG